jgi:hypothetical protein
MMVNYYQQFTVTINIVMFCGVAKCCIILDTDLYLFGKNKSFPNDLFMLTLSISFLRVANLILGHVIFLKLSWSDDRVRT